MTMKLSDLEAKIKELRPQLYDNSPIFITGAGPVVDVRVSLVGTTGRKGLELVRAINEAD